MGLLEQNAIIGDLYELLTVSVSECFDELKCEFTYIETENDGYKIGTSFSYTKNKLLFKRPLPLRAFAKIKYIIPKLHANMEGNWKSFVISFPKGGEASIKFFYE